MNLTWHIVKKDLRALKWPLAMWVLIMLTKLGIGAGLLTADGTEGPEWFTRMDMFSKLMAGLEGVSFVLVAALIHEDLLVGTTAFWMTRPISGARLLRAKLLGTGLIFGVLPVLVTLPWWLGCGYGLREIAWAATESVLVQAIFVLVGLLWATVTDGYARFLMWTLVMLVAIPTVGGIVGFHLSKLKPALAGSVVLTKVWVAIGLAVLGIATVVAHQFLTRRTARSIAVICTTVGLIIMVALWWRWDWKLEARWNAYLERQVEAAWPDAAKPDQITFAVTGAEVTKPVGARPDRRTAQLRVNYQVQGLTESQALLPYVATFGLRWPDGEYESGWSWIRSERSMQRMMARKALGLPTPDSPYNSVANKSLHAPVATRLLAEPAAFTLQLRYGVIEIEAMTRIPLEPGSRNLNGSLGERIAHVEKEGEQLMVTYVRHNPDLMIDVITGGQNYMLGVGRAMAAQFPQYLLVNRSQEFIDRGTTHWMHKTRVGTVEISWQTMAYKASKKAGGPRPVLEAINALNDAELLGFTFVEKGRFAYELKADPLVVTPANP